MYILKMCLNYFHRGGYIWIKMHKKELWRFISIYMIILAMYLFKYAL